MDITITDNSGANYPHADVVFPAGISADLVKELRSQLFSGLMKKLNANPSRTTQVNVIDDLYTTDENVVTLHPDGSCLAMSTLDAKLMQECMPVVEEMVAKWREQYRNPAKIGITADSHSVVSVIFAPGTSWDEGWRLVEVIELTLRAQSTVPLFRVCYHEADNHRLRTVVIIPGQKEVLLVAQATRGTRELATFVRNYLREHFNMNAPPEVAEQT